MITIYKYKADYPYSLHDMRVSKIESIGENVKLSFENGYETMTEPYKQVDGTIIIEDVDYDFCFAYLLSDNGGLGEFHGKKLELLDFLKKYPSFPFEIVDESYGYNAVAYSGYLSLPKRNNLIELTLSFYHFGNIVYETEE